MNKWFKSRTDTNVAWLWLHDVIQGNVIWRSAGLSVCDGASHDASWRYVDSMDKSAQVNTSNGWFVTKRQVSQFSQYWCHSLPSEGCAALTLSEEARSSREQQGIPSILQKGHRNPPVQFTHLHPVLKLNRSSWSFAYKSCFEMLTACWMWMDVWRKKTND